MIFTCYFRKKVDKKLKREEKERERWEGVLKGIEAKVNHEYGFHQYMPSNEPVQKWVPMDDDRKMDDINEASSIIEKRARTAASSKINYYLYYCYHSYFNSYIYIYYRKKS